MTDWQDRLKALATEYHFRIEDTPDILEEYILIDNEVLEQRNIENIIKEAYESERTQIGKNCLKQLLQSLE